MTRRCQGLPELFRQQSLWMIDPLAERLVPGMLPEAFSQPFAAGSPPARTPGAGCPHLPPFAAFRALCGYPGMTVR